MVDCLPKRPVEKFKREILVVGIEILLIISNGLPRMVTPLPDRPGTLSLWWKNTKRTRRGPTATVKLHYLCFWHWIDELTRMAIASYCQTG